MNRESENILDCIDDLNDINNRHSANKTISDSVKMMYM